MTAQYGFYALQLFEVENSNTLYKNNPNTITLVYYSTINIFQVYNNSFQKVYLSIIQVRLGLSS